MNDLKGNQPRALHILISSCANRAGVASDRFQAMYEDASLRSKFELELTELLARHVGRFNRFNQDATTRQVCFEPKNWALPIREQIDVLRNHLPGCVMHGGYLGKRLAKPVPAGLTRVVVPKFDYLRRLLCVTDVYGEIGVPIEYVCAGLEAKYGTGFMNCRKGGLTRAIVRCHAVGVARRKQAEAAIPGDIMILDVDLNNRIFGGKKKVCHTMRWSKEEIAISADLMHVSSVDIGWILLLNPGRVKRYGFLSVQSTLEEYFWQDEGWVLSLGYATANGVLRFGTHDILEADGGHNCWRCSYRLALVKPLDLTVCFRGRVSTAAIYFCQILRGMTLCSAIVYDYALA